MKISILSGKLIKKNFILAYLISNKHIIYKRRYDSIFRNLTDQLQENPNRILNAVIISISHRFFFQNFKVELIFYMII